MVLFIPPLDYRNLLPSLLACLPASFASPRAPPSILPLLSPILRQRVQLLSSTESSPGDSWLSLLCWKPDEAKKLNDLVKSDAFELHPVSGEIDYGDIEAIKYRQLDEETLQARVRIPDLDLVVHYLWCQEDQDGGGDGWRVLDLAPLAGHEETDACRWFATISEALEGVGEKIMINDQQESGSAPSKFSTAHETKIKNDSVTGADDDDCYWSRYNSTPGESPELTRPSAIQAHSTTAGPRQPSSESEYFSRYRHVQPEMDSDDPSQDPNTLGASSLAGDVMMASMRQTLATNANTRHSDTRQSTSSLNEDSSKINHPRVTSPSTGSIAVPRLEESAATQSVSEVAIRHHVSTSIKSLFRLTRGAGMDREEFDELVRTELDTLGMMTEDD